MKRTGLSIENPCHERWDEMSANEKGRFCQKCAKTVVDFTTSKIQDVKQVIKKATKEGERVCGRIPAHFLTSPAEGRRRRMYRFTMAAMIVFGSFLFSVETVQGQVGVQQEREQEQEQWIMTGDIVSIKEEPAEVTTEQEEVVFETMGEVVEYVDILDDHSDSTGKVTDEEGLVKGKMSFDEQLEQEEDLQGQVEVVTTTDMEEPMPLGMVVMWEEESESESESESKSGMKNINGELNTLQQIEIFECRTTGLISLEPETSKEEEVEEGIEIDYEEVEPQFIIVEEVPLYISSTHNDQLPNSSMTLYPNPGSEWVNVGLQLPSDGDFDLQVLDITGKVVQKRLISVGGTEYQEFKLDISKLPSGTYFCTVSGINNFYISQKLVVQ